MNTKKKLLFSFSFFVLLWCSLELVCYIVYQPSFFSELKDSLQLDRDLLWRQKPNYSGTILEKQVLTNSDGFRESGISNSTKTILNLGASPTFGLGVEASQTYSSLMQKQLEGYRIVNGGQIGYSSFQGRKLLEVLIDKMPISFVTLAFYINDMDTVRFFYQSNLSDHEAINTSSASLLNLLHNSFVFKMIGQMMQSHAKSITSELTARVDISHYKSNMIEMIQMLKRKEISVITIGIPINSTKSKASFISNKYLDSLMVVSKSEKVLNLDFREEFKDDKSLFATPLHPSPLGHSIIAGKLVEVIRKYQMPYKSLDKDSQ